MSDPAGPELQDVFRRIESQVEEGNTDLAALGFWPLVKQVKLEPRLAAHWADVVGRIDRIAFERRVRFRLPVWLGNLLLGASTVVVILLVQLALALARGRPDGGSFFGFEPGAPQPVVAGLLAVLGALGSSATLHDPAHWVAGRLAGMRFVAYFLKMPVLIPGLKIDYATYLRTSPGARAWMHASGAIVSKIAPFVVFAAVYLPHRSSGYDLFPSWSLWAILGFGLLQITTDILFSRKRSDWKRVRRERSIARAIDSIPRR